MAGDGGKNDLFGDSSSDDADTDDLIAAAKSQPIARKKKGAAPAATKAARPPVPDADGDSDSDDDEPEPKAGAGLFDSSSEDEEEVGPVAKKKTLGKKRGGGGKNKKAAAKARPAKKDTRSRKERMADLAKKRAGDKGGGDGDGEGDGGDAPRKKRAKGANGKDKEGGGGYASGDSYDSETIERTRADDEFIDADDEDPDALKELYAEQHFDDERPDGYDSDEEPKKKKYAAAGKGGGGGGGRDKISLSDDEGGEAGGASNALKAACRRMAKVKREKKSITQLEEEGTTFLKEMDAAADLDAVSIANRKPATKRLVLLPRVLDTLARKDMARVLLDLDLLSACKRWVEPLPNGRLGNVTLRRRVFEALATMTGENGISTQDLKRSGFGKTAMTLYMHRSETPEMKKLLKGAIEQWSRPIFQKSGNMRDLERAQAVRGANEMGSLVGLARSRQSDAKREERRRQSGGGADGAGRAGRGKTADDLAHIITRGAKATSDAGNERVRIPYSRGFQYSIRPESRRGDVSDRRNLVSAKAAAAAGAGGFRESDKRDALAKRMLDKSRKTNKQGQRSANISIEGRAVK